jgi:transcriptional regulator with XRE-family HTH domain
MKERLIEFLRIENKSSAQLAEEIGVQASGISHIISGRNNPSLDFVLKMLGKYKFLSTDWLLFGKGAMYKESRMQSLFDNSESAGVESAPLIAESVKSESETPFQENNRPLETVIPLNNTTSGIVRIIWFYADNSFDEYYPRK